MLKYSLPAVASTLPKRLGNRVFNLRWFALFLALVILPFVAYGQGSMQRLVRISGDNGNIVSLSAGNPAATYTLTLPPNTNPSTTAASVLFGTGSGLLDWTPASDADSGYVVQLVDVGGGQLKPRWIDPGTFTVTGNFWSLDGNAVPSAWDGTTGSFVGTTNTTPLILATTNTTTPQPIEFFTNNTERMHLAPTGELGIGVTPSSGVLLHVGGTAGTSNVRFNSLSGANLPLVFGANEGLLIADANGNLTKRDPAVLQQNYVQYDVDAQQAQSATRSNHLFNVGYDTTADDVNAVGALITSVGGATNRNATGLTVEATATGVGTATGLAVTAADGAINNAIDATGNIRLLSDAGTASRLSFQNPAGTFATTLSAGAQTANINYTLPIASPAGNGFILSTSATGVMSWLDPGTLAAGSYWTLTGNATADAYDGTTGSFLGTTSAYPLVLATTQGQAIQFFTDNAERMRLSSDGELGIGGPATSGRLLHVTGIAGTANIRFGSLAGSVLPLAVGANDGLLFADANGDITKRDPDILTRNYVQYEVGTPQAQALTRTENLFNVAYSATANDADAAGAVITSTAGATDRSSTGLSITSTATGAGTATGLVVTAAGSATRNAIDATGNIRLLSSGGAASALAFQNPAGTFSSTFIAGAQTANLTYTLPTTAPSAGQMLSSDAAGVLSWATPSGGVTGSGTATRVAFWGPGPGATTNLMDDANLFWDNTNYRLSIASGATPLTPIHATLNDAATATVANVLTLDHTTSGTPATGFGEAINFRLQTGTGGSAQIRDAAQVGALWRTASDTYRTGDLTFSTVDSGTASEKVRITGEGYVGIGNTDPNYSADITGAYGTRASTITLSSSSPNHNVYIGNSSYVRIVGPTGPFTMTGMGQGFDGKRVRVANLTGQDWTIIDSSSSSSAGNRFVTGTNSDVTIKGPVSVLDFIYDGPTSQWFLGTLNANQIIGSVGSLVYRYKTADESVTNSSVIQDDDHLYFYMNAGESWEINGEIDVSNPANNYDIKCAFEIPTSSSMKIMFTGIQDAGGNAIQGNGQFTASNQTKLLKINFGVHTLITFRGIVRAGSSGYIKFRWAQDVANLTNPTTVHEYSYLKITRVQ